MKLKKLFEKNLQNKFLLLFVLVSLIPIVGITYYSCYVSWNATRKTVEQTSLSQLKSIDSVIYEKVKNIERFSDVVSTNGEIQKILLEDNNNYMRFESLVRKCAVDVDDILGAIFITPNGNTYTYNLNSTKIDEMRLQVLYDKINEKPRALTWFGNKGNDEKIGLNENVFLVGMTFHYEEADNLKQIAKGYLYIDKSIFTDVLNNTQATASVSILDKFGTLVDSNDKEKFNELTGESMKFTDEIYKTDESAFSLSFKNNKYSVVHYSSAYTDFKYVKIDNFDTFNKEIYRVVTTAVVVIVLLFLIIIFLYIIISREITAPISKLALIMKNFGDSTLQQRIDIKGDDEVKNIVDGFNKMMEKITAMIAEIKSREEQKKDAQVKALSYQINPHFLYNTLGAIRLTAIKHNDEEIATALLALNKILKSVFSNTNNYVTLLEETQSLNNYIKLMGLRYQNKIDFKINLPKDAQKLLIPAMLIQPIIENSIMHGLTPRLNNDDFEAKCYINFKVNEDNYVVEIWDNGEGMSEEQIKTVFETIKHEKNGIGVSNVCERLRLIYGEKYNLSINSEVGKYTAVYITLPQG